MIKRSLSAIGRAQSRSRPGHSGVLLRSCINRIAPTSFLSLHPKILPFQYLPVSARMSLPLPSLPTVTYGSHCC
jgi:hypothetical protein